ncbi:uncharacterized protein LOC112602114 [Melanaphis sacchari]|uniref:uncharacterized protein LOC112602114 n=1 Tax=Melanaphis sacchari TaxID=742174 RepID=UPI000DC15049|nr:uncharacterized protein LOC112602114 [Melanaphis sacchari]
MRLCDKDIKIWLNKKKLIITPYPKNEVINGVTLDLHLDLKNSMSEEEIFSKEKPFFLKPGSLALFSTLESITLPDNLVGWLDGRSSLARLGLMIHVTSHRIDPGWNGNIVLEIFNAGSLVLVLSPGIKIAALSFELLSQSVRHPYNSRYEAKYKIQKGVVPSRIYKE